MRAYCAVIFQQLINSFSRLASFRLSLYLTAFTDIAFAVTSYYSADILFRHLDHIGSWERPHFMFFILWVQGVSTLHTGIGAPNFWNFSYELRTGNLDFRLIRPLGSLFDVFTAVTRPMPLLLTPIYLLLLIPFGMEIGVSLAQWLLLPILFALSFIAMFLVELLISMSMFWTTAGDGVNFIRIQSQQLQKWPDFMYPQGLQYSLGRIIPLLAAVPVPVRVMFGTAQWWELPLLILGCVAMWWGIAVLWRIGLQRYESASS